MPWVSRLLRGDRVWVKVGPAGEPQAGSDGRVDVLYKKGGKVYRAALRNLEPDPSPIALPDDEAAPGAPATEGGKRSEANAARGSAEPMARPPSQVTCAQTSSCSQACPEKHLADCVAACAARIGGQGRPYWDVLQRCSADHCAAACVSPTALSCKLCVMGNCAAAATSCLSH